MSGRVVVATPAKINLSLGVGPVRSDGYHPLATVYQAIGLFDEVAVQPGDEDTLALIGEGVDVSDVPVDESNLAMKAAALLAAHHGIDEGVEMVIRKRIPVAGGMAGGSADAAGALVACDALWETNTPREELMEIAAELGSDVPFCLVGGTAVGSGRGELVAPAMTRGTYWWVVALAPDGLSTPRVYAEFDRLAADAPVPEPEIPEELMAALRLGDADLLGKALTNDLQPAVFTLRPELEQLLASGIEGSAHGAVVSGSGPTCLFLGGNENHANLIRGWLRDSVPDLLVAPGPVPGAHVIR
ncbi:MAG: 4-(cytidine 5'-diphospho)-2-C-methyl-D-erythritol kinase [Nocardioidaceae bacterium]